MGLLDDLSRKGTYIHRIHPLSKLIVTFAYLAAVVSFDRYEISSLIPFVFYPALIFALAELPALQVLRRVSALLPVIAGIGILNPLFDNQSVVFAGLVLSRGWLTFLSVFIKGALTVTASMLLIGTTGLNPLASALRMLGVPRMFVLQLLLTYRYISVLAGEVSRLKRAYSLRAPSHKGVHISAWGPFAGQLLLRTFDRAQRVYQAMNLRGFDGEYNTGGVIRYSFGDFMYMLIWCVFFIIARKYDLPMMIGSFLMGVTG